MRSTGSRAIEPSFPPAGLVAHGRGAMIFATTVSAVRGLIVTTLALTAMITAGCSDDDQSGAGTSAASAAPTTVESTSTTSTSTTSTTTTTASPTTTVDPEQALIAEIEADLNEGEQALLAALAVPSDPASRTLLERYFSGRSLESALQSLDRLATDGLIARPNPDTPNLIVIRALKESSPSVGQAVIDLCRIDAAVVVELLPGGEEAVVNDAVTVYQSESLVVMKDGTWVFDSGKPIADAEPVDSCE